MKTPHTDREITNREENPLLHDMDSARKIAAALNKKPEELFTLHTETMGLSLHLTIKQ